MHTLKERFLRWLEIPKWKTVTILDKHYKYSECERSGARMVTYVHSRLCSDGVVRLDKHTCPYREYHPDYDWLEGRTDYPVSTKKSEKSSGTGCRCGN